MSELPLWKHKLHHRQLGLPRSVYIRRSVELAGYGYADKCIGCQHARLGLKRTDHSEECRARIVRHRPPMMTSVRECKLRNNELLKLHHQKRKLENEILCWKGHEIKSDSRNELKNKHQRVL